MHDQTMYSVWWLAPDGWRCERYTSADDPVDAVRVAWLWFSDPAMPRHPTLDTPFTVDHQCTMTPREAGCKPVACVSWQRYPQWPQSTDVMADSLHEAVRLAWVIFRGNTTGPIPMLDTEFTVERHPSRETYRLSPRKAGCE